MALFGKSRKQRARRRQQRRKERREFKLAKRQQKTDRQAQRQSVKKDRIAVRSQRVAAKEASGFYTPEAVAARSAAWGNAAGAAVDLAGSALGISPTTSQATAPTATSGTSSTGGLPEWALPVGLAAVAVGVVLLTTSKKKGA